TPPGSATDRLCRRDADAVRRGRRSHAYEAPVTLAVGAPDVDVVQAAEGERTVGIRDRPSLRAGCEELAHRELEHEEAEARARHREERTRLHELRRDERGRLGVGRDAAARGAVLGDDDDGAVLRGRAGGEREVEADESASTV